MCAKENRLLFIKIWLKTENVYKGITAHTGQAQGM
jgi:hypothetical protein